jgi:signal transduction histidine kinase
VLYLATQHALIGPVDKAVTEHAQMRAGEWQRDSILHACSPISQPTHFDHPATDQQPPIDIQPQIIELIACYDKNGVFIQNSNTAQLPSAFLTSTLVKQALNEGSATGTIHLSGTTNGYFDCYALAIPNSPDDSGAQGSGYSGVILIGDAINTQIETLSLLLVIILIVGSVTLLGAGLGGLFLANRALAPAHLAFMRQQRFIADASHELRTPLTLMRADAEVLLRGRKHLADEDAELLEDIVAEANHMSILANSMLTLARLDSGMQHREHEVVNLDELARRGVQRVTAFAEQKGVTVRHKSGAIALTIGDSTLLEQAVLILLDNAIKYNRAGGEVTIYTSITEGRACLKVVDSGIGISPEHLPYLSERFYRVDKARSREAGGAGLGLSIAHGIATMHNGTLTLTSIVEQGTTATLSLPLASLTPPPTNPTPTVPNTLPLPPKGSQRDRAD